GGYRRLPGGRRPARLAHARCAHGAAGKKGRLPHARRRGGAFDGAESEGGSVMEKNGVWVFCENGPQGVREVSCELLGVAARLAKQAGTRVIAVALGANAPAEELCARGAD